MKLIFVHTIRLLTVTEEQPDVEFEINIDIGDKDMNDPDVQARVAVDLANKEQDCLAAAIRTFTRFVGKEEE